MEDFVLCMVQEFVEFWFGVLRTAFIYSNWLLQCKTIAMCRA